MSNVKFTSNGYEHHIRNSNPECRRRGQSVSQSIGNAIDSALPYVWVLVSLAIIGVGLLCIIGSDRSKEVAKSKFVYICIGAALVLAAAYIGKGITSALNGAGDWASVAG